MNKLFSVTVHRTHKISDKKDVATAAAGLRLHSNGTLEIDANGDSRSFSAAAWESFEVTRK